MRILSLSPTRISLAGGGTDVGEYARKYGGLCINFAINIRQKMEIVCGEVEDQFGNVTFPTGATLGFYTTILAEMGVSEREMGIEAVFDGHINGGLGTSASAAVCLIGAINKYKNMGYSREDIAEAAWNIETKRLGLFGGKQDQYASSFGGINAMWFKNKVEVYPLNRDFIEDVLPGLILFYTGSNRASPKIQEGLKTLSSTQKLELDEIKRIALEAIPAIGSGDIEKVGTLLDESWYHKKRSNRGVSTPEFDELYDKAKKIGVWGGKLIGSGGGGYCIFVIDPSKRQKLIDGLKIEQIDFDVDFNGVDVRIL